MHRTLADFALYKDVDGLNEVFDLLKSRILKVVDEVLAVDILHLHHHLCVGLGDVENLWHAYELQLRGLGFLLFEGLLIEPFYIFGVAGGFLYDERIALAHDFNTAAGMTFYFDLHGGEM